MPPSSRIPPLLQHSVRLPRDDSILLLTSTLGATANWLVVRFLCDALSSKDGGAAAATTSGEADAVEVNVVLVSWMREYEFWKQEARKGGGLDLERLRKDGRFAFVDGLSALFLPQDEQAVEGENKSQTPASTARAPPRPVRASQMPIRGPPPLGSIPTRGPPARQGAPPAFPKATASTSNSQLPGLYTLRSADLAGVKFTITSALTHVHTTHPHRKTLLVIDNPDILLATSPSLNPTHLTSLFLTLHTRPSVSHLLIHIQADTPLIALSTPPQPLEVSQHNFLVKVAHMSRRVLSVRVLDTGVARDVSGVLRVTEGKDDWVGLGMREAVGEGREDGNKEVLYKIGGDGSVRVFERGAGGEG